MRIAYFSPLPPKKTGIATYSAHAVEALRTRADVELFEGGAASSTFAGLPVHDIVARPDELARLGEFDGCMYHLGNNPFFHLDIYGALLRHPGVVVLHDTVLYFLMAGQGRGGLLKEFCLNYGADRISEYWDLLRHCPDGEILRYPHPERYPLLGRVLDRATAVIVHSQVSRDQLIEGGYRGDVSVVPLMAYVDRPATILPARLDQLRHRHGLRSGQLVLSSLGFLGETKRMTSVFRALAILKETVDFRFFVVGEGMDLRKRVDEYGLADHVIETGFVDDQDFEHYLALSDVVVNLRYPSMGEASATLVQALTFEKPSIVTDHAWFSELPDEVVRKIGYGPTEVDELVTALRELCASAPARAELGAAGRAFIDRTCTPGRVAEGYVSVVERSIRGLAPVARVC